MSGVQHCTEWEAEYPDSFLRIMHSEKERASSERRIRIEKNHWGEIIFCAVKELSSKYEQTAERAREGCCQLLRGSLAFISWSCWDLSCLCHSETSPIFFQEPEPRRGMLNGGGHERWWYNNNVLLIIFSIPLINCRQREEGRSWWERGLKILCKLGLLVVNMTWSWYRDSNWPKTYWIFIEKTVFQK